MMLNKDLPKKIPVFPLSNFIIFPKTTVPLNIFEPRYIQMIDDSMKSNRYIGMIQPRKTGDLKKPDLYKIGCVGKITSFNETEDGRYLIVLNGICRYETINEVSSNKLYRECEVNFKSFSNDLVEQKEQLMFSDLKQIFKNLKKLFESQGYQINWNDLKNQSIEQTLNTLSMASPFTLEEKQILLETQNLNERKNKLEEILLTYTNYSFTNKTIQ